MRRVAAHFIFYRNEVFHMHYLELDDTVQVSGIYPFREEIAGTVFVDGIVFPVPRRYSYDALFLKERLLHLHRKDTAAGWACLLSRLLVFSKDDLSPVDLFRLHGVDLATSELRTNNGCGDCHIVRF